MNARYETLKRYEGKGIIDKWERRELRWMQARLAFSRLMQLVWPVVAGLGATLALCIFWK